jgi:hypothetical protein
MRELDKVAEALFEKIRSRFEGVTIGDENAKTTQDPENARFINFQYITKSGENLGNITVSLIDENSIKVYYSKNITDGMPESETQEWFDFLRGIRMFAKRNMMDFDTRDITKQALDIKDIKQQSKSDSAYTSNEVTIGESRMYGTRRSSYDRMGETRIIVRHSAPVDEEKRGCRTRNIESIYVETSEGERFKLPFTNLTGARAIGQHIAQGGNMLDERAGHIIDLVKEMAALRTFVSATRNQVFEDDVTPVMIEAAKRRYQNVRKGLKSMRGPRGYGFYWAGSGMDSSGDAGGIGEDEIKDRLTRRVFDERLEEALPYVRRAYSQYLDSQNTPMGREFESWADDMVEGTWAQPDDAEKINALKELMTKPLLLGADAADATGALYDIIGDDDLFDELESLAKQDAQADARPVVQAWLEQNMPEVAQQVVPALEQPEQPEQQPVPAQPTESVDPDLAMLKWLSGLRK